MMEKSGSCEEELVDCFLLLPESVVHHILSFLPFNHIVRCSVLSKTWNHIWSNYPNIDLNLGILSPPPHLFLGRIERILDQCLFPKVCIQKMHICIYVENLEGLPPIMDRALAAAVERNISELVIKIHGRPNILYSIPQEVFVAESLKVLDLEECMFEDRFSSIHLPNLQTFKLFGCLFANENMLQKILCGCPNIEFLKVMVCKGVGSFLSISSKSRLKFVSIGCAEALKRIEIFAPSLETLKCTLLIPCSFDLASCTVLKHLELRGAFLSVDYISIQYLLSKLLYIEELELHNCKVVNKIQISSLCLKRLVISDCNSFHGAEIDTPNLLSLDFLALGACDQNNRFSSWNVHKVEEIHLVFSFVSFQDACRGGLKGFLMQLQNYEDLKLVIECRDEQDFIMHEKLHAVSFSSLTKFLKKVKPECVVISSRRNESFLTNMFVSTSGPINLFLISSSRRSIELLHKKLSKEEILKCWYSDTQLFSNEEEIYHEMDSASKSFMKTHSNGYHTARIVLIRRTVESMLGFFESA